MAKRVALAVAALLLAVPAAGFFLWLTLGGGAWLSDVEVLDVQPSPDDPTTLSVGVSSCNSFPRVSRYEVEGAVLRLQIEAFTTPLSGSNACADVIEVGLGFAKVTEVFDFSSGKTFQLAG